MSAEGMDQTADLTTAGFARWSGTTKRERNFWIALGCAAILHASFFVGAIASKPERLGDESGADNAISVSLVTEADLESKSTVAEPAEPPPAPPPSPAQQPKPEQPKPPEPQAKQEPQPEPPKPPEPEQQQAKPEDAPKPPDDTKPADKTEQQVAKVEDPKAEDDAPDLFSLQDENPANMKSAPKPKPKPKTETSKSSASKSSPKRQKRMSSLDLSTPQSMMQPSFGGGHAAAFQRPPGITRSGLNDAFARAVIKALQQTMPQLSDVLGRVTVRIFLSESGNVIDVKLLAGAKNSSLNQDVVFAARQTSYPIPPAGSNVADRTFMVTYIYD
ncbi:MAG TPA: energy transducer TonB [Hyphomicrobium sp.]